ncbi:MAG: glycosyltransferase [Gammaproteobacteria bacterium]|nr:glycosyltransferase [Gammaproteobacteria bacterium]
MKNQNRNERETVVFLGGVFLPSQISSILENSRGVVQNAADALQKAFLKGFAVSDNVTVQLVNLPFISSFPKLYKQAVFPSCDDMLSPNIKARGEGFLNLRFFRPWSRFVSAHRGLRHAVRSLRSPVIVVYSAHLPFLAAARLVRLFRKDVLLCAILPDLPEFMGVGGRLYVLFKSIESMLFRKVVGRYDSFVFLTDAMGERLKIPSNRRIVVEGIFDTQDYPNEAAGEVLSDGEFKILYTGTLAMRYGIVDLLRAFERIENSDFRLWICGDGDARSTIEAMASRDTRVHYFGQVPRTKALSLQRQASVLVNPRRPEGEFTRYSFPSKTMEYLASGKPVIMHALPGIPPEYFDHLIIPRTPDAEGLAEALLETADTSPDALAKRGDAGRKFVLTQKSPEAQVSRVLHHWAAQRGELVNGVKKESQNI